MSDEMASETRVIVPDANGNGCEDTHPLAHITAQNNEVPLFKKIPSEILLKIYELAVVLDDPIYPTDLMAGSNKYTLVSKGKKLQPTVVALSQVCRKIYEDLKYCPIFYRVNTFSFNTQISLHAFLAAITPQRRAAIRYIEIDEGSLIATPGDVRYWRHRWLNWNADYQRNSVLTLLSQCHDLRELSYVIPPFEHFLAEAHTSLLKTYDICSPWNLPTFRLLIRAKGTDSIHTYEMGVEDGFEVPAWLQEIDPDPAHARQLRPINDALVRRKRLFRREEKRLNDNKDPQDKQYRFYRPKWFDDMKANVGLAVTAARIDMPGEIRISQDPINDTFGPISSRTRARVGSYDYSSGRCIRDFPRYNVYGGLAWSVMEISGVRLNHSEVQCKVTCNVATADDRLRYKGQHRTFWTPIHSLVGEYDPYRLLEFYRYMANPRSPVPLEGMRGTLPPREVSKSVGGITGLLAEETNAVSRRAFCRRWKSVETRWNSRLARLEKRAAVSPQNGNNSTTAGEAQEEEDMSQDETQVSCRGAGWTPFFDLEY
ncbi:uncharacterized protein F4822DRAFT_429606 [Hypoxylon trugodes]|uniref:uncharacterized protein n=1 Tax=Hypoxylon trugodes TaxID=326681 RepID=UPI00218F3342|nr:uncharacterized protein F4822DRAFT_429606 [Hypoxylon trugodes]KAI1388992.1 hypothetical protein F4822DRAFT_429606 [Hypoxylon trugodes]